MPSDSRTDEDVLQLAKNLSALVSDAKTQAERDALVAGFGAMHLDLIMRVIGDFSESSNKWSKRLHALTLVIVALTVAMAGLAGVQLFVTLSDFGAPAPIVLPPHPPVPVR